VVSLIGTVDYVLPAGQSLSFNITDVTSYQPLLMLETDLTTDVEHVTIAGSITLTTDPLQARQGTELGVITTSDFHGDRHASVVDITPTGVLHVDTSASNLVPFGIFFGGTPPPVVNEGLIDVKADQIAVGVFVQAQNSDFGQAVTNIGTIHVVSLDATAEGVQANGEFGVVNSGVIDVSGQSGSFGVSVGDPGLFQNTGSIVVHDLGPGGGSIGVGYLTTGNAHFLNAGLIQADIAISAGQIDASGTKTAADSVYENTGHILGEVDLSDGVQTLLNENTIVGAVNLGVGDDVYDGRRGVETGLVSGGDGADTLMGGTGFDNLQGNQGDDSVSGAAGDDIVVGGKGNDVQAGGDGNDIVWGNLGNDTLDGGDGADQVRGGQGDDSLSGGAGDDFVSGDRGNDTETGGAGADLFHTFSGAGIDKVLDFHLAEGDRVMVDPGTVFMVSQVGADTVIDMGNGDQMILVGVQMSTLTGSWIFGA
jgi:Ca2+-binding RTX toxin-like protein